MLAALFAGGAAWAAIKAFRAQTEQTRIANIALAAQNQQARVDMWRAMVEKFDSAHFHGARYATAVAWLDKRQGGVTGFKKIVECQRVMDFFEDVAYLVHNDLIDRRLAQSSFEDFFVNYFLAAEEIMIKDRGDDAEYYEHVFALKPKWAPNAKVSGFENGSVIQGDRDHDDMIEFFKKERDMCEPNQSK